MRTIKFREWMRNDKKMRYFYLGQQVRSGTPSLEELHIMQFTGLLDKKGKEIYEGDIVMGRATYESKDTPEEVRWIDKTTGDGGGMDLMGWFPLNIYSTNGQNSCADEFYDLDNCEVIGNIYENNNILK